MNIGRIIDCFKDVVIIERRGVKTLGADGLFTGPDKTTFTPTSVSVQPISGKEMQILPEGVRTTQSKKFYSRQELRVADAPNGIQSDRVIYKNESYEIFSVQDWNDQGGYFKSFGKKIKQ